MNFKIQLLTLNSVNETDNTAYYVANVLADFVDQSAEYKALFPKLYVSSDWSRVAQDQPIYSYPERTRTFSYTYEESISLHQNGQAEFSFKMDNFIIQQNEWIQNPFIDAIVNGSQIAVTSLDETRIFTVKKIGASFSANNCTYSYTCQDSFSYQLSRQNKGYTINNDSTSDDFIGAKTIDYWADKICTECHIPYHYIPLKKPLFLVDNLGTTEVSSTANNVTQVLKTKYSEENESEYFETIIFSVSSSSANEALISLGEKYGMQLKVYEYLGQDISTNQYFIKRYIWFFPLKDGDHLSGWTYNPSSNIQSFSLTQSAENLSTVLNVNSNESNDDLISLFPPLPPFFSKVYGSTYWLNSTYYSGYFSQLCQYYTEFFTENLIKIDKRVEKVTSLDGRLEDYSLFLFNRKVISSERLNRLKLYNKISFNNSDVYSFCTSGDLYSYSNINGWLLAYQKDETSTWIYYTDEDEISEEVWNNLLTYLTTEDKVSYQFAVAILGNFTSLSSYSINFFFTRNWSQEELDYAAIADLCPWLENKLIDFKYMSDANIISKKQYLEIEDYFNNKLRIVNGQLALYSNEYYTAYHKKTTTLADLLSQLDSLAAMAEADLIQPYQDTGKVVTSLENFKLAYSLLWQDKKQSAEKTSIIDYDKTITYYSKLYFNAQQRFLKNIYNFRKYFEENNSRFADGTLLTTITITSKRKDSNNEYWLGLKNPSLYTLFTEKNYEENPPLYQKSSDNIFNRVYPVTEDNLSNYFVFNEKSLGKTALNASDSYQKDQEYWAYLYTKTEGEGDNAKTVTYKDNGIPTLDESDEGKDGYAMTRTVMKPIANYTLDDPQMGDIWVMRNSDQVYQRNENTYTPIVGNWPITAVSMAGINKTNKQWNEALTEITYNLDTNTPSECDYYNFNFGKNSNPIFIDTSFLDLATLMSNYQDESDKKALRELYAKYFPVENYYYKETDTSISKPNYRQISLVTYQNESSYYRHVTGDSVVRTVLIVFGGIALGGVVGGIGAGIAAACIRSHGYNTETWETSGESQAPIDFYYKDWGKQISNWSNNFYFPWYLKDSDDAESLITLVQKVNESSEISLTYSNFFNLLGLTYSCLSLTPTESVSSDTMKEAPITGSIAKHQKEFYYKESYARFMKGTENCNPDDTYYIIPLITFYDQTDNNENSTYENCFRRAVNYSEKGRSQASAENSRMAVGPLSIGSSATFDTPIKNFQTHINEVNSGRISTILNYPLFNAGTTITFNKENFNPNGKTSLEEVLKGIYNYGIRSEGNIFYGSCELVDSGGNKLDPMVDYTEITGRKVFSVNYKTLTSGSTFYSHTAFIVLHKEDYDKFYPYTDAGYSPLSGRSFYYNDDDSKVDFSTASGIVEGFYTQVNVADEKTLKQATKLDDSLSYFDSNYNRAYTIEQYRENAAALKIYTLFNNTYQTNVVLSPSQPTLLSIPTTCNKILEVSKNKMQTISESTLDIYLVYKPDGKIYFCDANGESRNDSWQIGESYEGNYYEGTLSLTCSNNKIPKDLGKLSNGELWYLYHNNEDESVKVLLEYSAIIETQLQTYWSAAYGASKGCDYFLPQYWQPTIVADINYFSKDILINTGTEDSPNLQISQRYVPIVSIVKSGKDTLLPDYNWNYETNIEAQNLTETQKLIIDYNNLSNDTEKAMNQNPAISDFLNNLSYLGEPLQHWVLQPLNGVTKTYYIKQTGGCTWPQLVSQITNNTYSAGDFNGTYPMLLKKWGQHYDIDEMLNYNKLLTKHNNLWEEIYQNYPSIILEDNFSDSDAVSSNDLLKGARNYLRQYYQPENDFSVTVINRSELTGSGYVPSIGQGILVDPTYYSNLTSTNFSSAVQQYLFVTDVSYTLRSASDIKLTVNAIKYSDKLIQRLAKLIK